MLSPIRAAMRRPLLVLCLLVAGPLCSGCQLVPFFTEQKREVPAEFDKLPGKRVAVMVWTPPETRFDFPYVQVELADFIGDKLRAELFSREQSIELVDATKVADYLQRNPDAEIDPQTVGEEFHADYVVFVEILRFQIRDPERPQFVWGKVEASVAVRDVNADPDQPSRYELSPVRTVFPENGPLPMTANNPYSVRGGTYQKFSEQVARKFYDYTTRPQ